METSDKLRGVGFALMALVSMPEEEALSLLALVLFDIADELDGERGAGCE